MRSIARKLTTRGVPTWADLHDQRREKKMGHGEWAEGSVNLILRNPTYAGYAGRWEYNASDGQIIVVEVEPLVDQETWDLAQRMRRQNRTRQARDAVPSRNRKDEIDRAIDDQRQRMRRLVMSYLDGNTAQSVLDDAPSASHRVETLQQFIEKVSDLLPIVETLDVEAEMYLTPEKSAPASSPAASPRAKSRAEPTTQ